MKPSAALFVLLALTLPTVPVLAEAEDGSKAASGASMQMHGDMMKGAKESMAMQPSGNVDQDFAKMMRHHHETGMRMAEHEARNGKDPEMRAMAQKIRDSQKKEIEDFDRWMQKKGAK